MNITISLLDNTFMDNEVPVGQYTRKPQFGSMCSIHSTTKVVFMLFNQLSQESIQIYCDVGRIDTIIAGLAFLYSSRDLLLFLHDAVFEQNTTFDIDWETSNDEGESIQLLPVTHVHEEAVKTKVHEKDDEFLQFQNF